MSVRESLRAASASTALQGVVPRIFGQRIWLAVFVVVAASATALTVLSPATRPFATPLIFLVCAITFAPTLWVRRSSIEYNAAAEALSQGRIDEGEQRLIAFFRHPRLDFISAMAFHQLGFVALRRGRFRDAAAFFRASFDLEKARLFANAGSVGGHARASLALALIADGRLTEARDILAAPEPEGAFPAARASLASSRALFALRTNDAAGALRVLEMNRRVMQNVLTGNDAALAEVLEAAALAALAATPQGAPRPTHPVPVDAEARAYLTRLLPECEPLLIDELG